MKVQTQINRVRFRISAQLKSDPSNRRLATAHMLLCLATTLLSDLPDGDPAIIQDLQCSQRSLLRAIAQQMATRIKKGLTPN